MSNDPPHTDLEDRVRDLLVRHLQARQADLAELGLRFEVEPVNRQGVGASYASSVEATLRWPDNDVCDVIFVNIAERGHRVVELNEVGSWIAATIEASVDDARNMENGGK